MLCPFGVGRKKKKHNLDKKQIVMVVKREEKKGGRNIILSQNLKRMFQHLVVHNEGTWEQSHLTPVLSHLEYIGSTITNFVPNNGNTHSFSVEDGKV